MCLIAPLLKGDSKRVLSNVGIKTICLGENLKELQEYGHLKFRFCLTVTFILYDNSCKVPKT